jgi:hypothetical protein
VLILWLGQQTPVGTHYFSFVIRHFRRRAPFALYLSFKRRPPKLLPAKVAKSVLEKQLAT